MKGMIMSAVIGASLPAGTTCWAAENNPFGLVYENAITENVAGKINIHSVTYKLHGLDIVAAVDGQTYFPGYHMNKRSWISLLLDGSVPAEELYSRIDDSYLLAKK